MVWVLIILVALMVMGSVMWLKPSARDKRLADLRLDAIKRKLAVKQYTWKPDAAKTGVREEIMATSYTLVAPGAKGTGTLLYRLVGQPAWDTEGLPSGFAWHDKGTPGQAAEFSSAVGSLTDNLLMLEVFSNRVSMMTAENDTATAENYEAFMKQLLPKV